MRYCIVNAMHSVIWVFGERTMLTVLACIASVLGIAWLLVLYPSFRKACAIVLGIAIGVPAIVYGIAEFIAFEQRHAQAVQEWKDSGPAQQANHPRAHLAR